MSTEVKGTDATMTVSAVTERVKRLSLSLAFLFAFLPFSME